MPPPSTGVRLHPAAVDSLDELDYIPFLQVHAASHRQPEPHDETNHRSQIGCRGGEIQNNSVCE